MKKDVENNLANQAPQVEELALSELNAQPTVVPEQQPVEFSEAPVGTPAPEKKNNFGEKLKSLKNKLFAHGVGPIIAVAVVAVAAVALTVFGVMSSSPKQVFKGTINKAFKEVENAIDLYDEYMKKFDFQEKAILVDFDMSLDTNFKQVKDEIGFDIQDLTLGVSAGVDLKNEMVQVGAKVEGEKEKLDATAQIIEDQLYLTSSLFDEVLTDEEKMEIDFGELKKELEEFEKEYSTNPEDYKYLVKTIKDALNKSLNSKHMEKEKVELEIGGDSFKATKFSYIIDEDVAQELTESMIDYLLDDDDFVKVLSDVSGLEKDKIKDTLKETKKSAKDIKFKDEIIINLYTTGLFNKAAGFGIEFDGKEYVSYYVKGKNAELVVDNHVKDEYSKMKIVATIEEDGKEQSLSVKYNGTEIATGTIRELSENVIDMSVSVEAEGEKLTLDVYLSAEEKDDKISGKYEVKIQVNDEYIGVKGNYGIAAQSELDKVDTKKAVDVDDFDYAKYEDEILKKIENDKVLNALYEAGLEEYEKENIKLNYDGMLVINSSDVTNVLNRKRATVLYVGDDYYSSYSNPDAYSMYENLYQAQKDLDFYSHFLNTAYLTDMSFLEASLKDVQYTCSTTAAPITDPTTGTSTPATCQNYPAIYLIKDGKVVKAFRGTVTLEDLKAALTELGI